MVDLSNLKSGQTVYVTFYCGNSSGECGRYKIKCRKLRKVDGSRIWLAGKPGSGDWHVPLSRVFPSYDDAANDVRARYRAIIEKYLDYASRIVVED